MHEYSEPPRADLSHNHSNEEMKENVRDVSPNKPLFTVSSDSSLDENDHSTENVSDSPGTTTPTPEHSRLSSVDRDHERVTSPALPRSPLAQTLRNKSSSPQPVSSKGPAVRVRKISMPLQVYVPEGGETYGRHDTLDDCDDDMFMKSPDVCRSPTESPIPRINQLRSISTPVQFMHHSSNLITRTILAHQIRKSSVPLPMKIPEDRETTSFSYCTPLGSPPSIFISSPRYNAQVFYQISYSYNKVLYRFFYI